MMINGRMTMTSKWTNCCRRGRGEAGRTKGVFCLVQQILCAIVLFCVTSSAFLWILLMNTPKNSMIKTDGERVNVLLFSYYRSGSTFLGSMFNLNPNAFYWFEPLAAATNKWGWVADKIPPRNFYHYDNGTEKSIASEDMRTHLLSPLSLIYACNITAMPLLFFRQPFMRSPGWTSKMVAFADYFHCVDRSRAMRRNRSSSSSSFSYSRFDEAVYRKCLPILMDRCRRSSIVVVKTIRLQMQLLEEMLRKDATLRLVYMVRDPRGMLNSWWTTTGIAKRRYSLQEMESDAKLICKRMLSDWRIFERVQIQHPNRCLRFRYEVLAEAPELVVQMVYSFLGFQETPTDVLTGIRQMTSANKSDGAFGVRRTNSSATAQNWKTRLTPDRQQIIADNCHELLEAVGYP